MRKRVKPAVTRLGRVTQRVLLLLMAGMALGFSHSPSGQRRILKGLTKEWETIQRAELYRTVRRLYESQLVRSREHSDGTTEIVLTQEGKERALRYKLEEMSIAKPERWDRKWRVILFDVPEEYKTLRDALREQFRKLGLKHYQKSVFIHPYECRDEIDFVIELFGARRYVRYIVADALDNELHFKKKFRLI